MSIGRSWANRTPSLTVRWESKETVGTAGRRSRGDADAVPTAVGPVRDVRGRPARPARTRSRGEDGVATVGRAEVVATDPHGVTFKAALSDGGSLVVRLDAAGHGVIRVRLADDPQARTRSARAADPGPSPAPTPPRSPSTTPTCTSTPERSSPRSASTRGTCGSSPPTAGCCSTRTRAPGTSAADGAPCRSAGPPPTAHPSPGTRASSRSATNGSSASGRSSPRWTSAASGPLMWNFDAFGGESDRSHKNVPFYLSDRGYGVLVDSGMPVEFDMCQSTHSSVQILVPDDLIDYYVLAGPTPTEVLDRFDELDRPALPAAEVGLRGLDLVGVLPRQPAAGAGAGPPHPRAGNPLRRAAPGLLLAGRRPLVGPALGRRGVPRPGRDAGGAHRAGLPGLPVDEPVPDDGQPALRRRGPGRVLPAPRRRQHVRRGRAGTAAIRPAPSSTSPTPTRSPGSGGCCGHCWSRGWRCSRPTSPRRCRPTRWHTTG